MIQCNPRGICSWSFDVKGPDVSIQTEHNTFDESGHLIVNGGEWMITKEGLNDPEWNMHNGSEVIIKATNPSTFTCTFLLHLGDAEFTLEAESTLGRTMKVTGPSTNFLISPTHTFTRRANIQGDCCNLEIVAISFWLTLLLWRRQANNN